MTLRQRVFFNARPPLLAAAALALTGCAALSRAPMPDSSITRSPQIPGITTLSGEDLQRSGRTNLSEALRASSPLFH